MNKEIISVALSKSIIQKLKLICEREQRSRSNYIELAVEEKISKNNHN